MRFCNTLFLLALATSSTLASPCHPSYPPPRHSEGLSTVSVPSTSIATKTAAATVTTSYTPSTTTPTVDESQAPPGESNSVWSVWSVWSSTTSVLEHVPSSSTTTSIPPVTPLPSTGLSSSASLTSSAPSTVNTSPIYYGMGTRYGDGCTEEDCWQNGACSFVGYDLPPGIDGSTCISQDIWDNGGNCGGCISVTYKGKTITVMVTNQTGGNATHLDMTPDTWALLTDNLSAGGVPTIEWEWTTCPIAQTSPLEIHMHGGASQWWFAATVQNARYRTVRLEVSSDGGNTWRDTHRESYNAWVLDGTLPSNTASVRVTSDTGSVVVVDNVALVSGQVTKATKNYS